MKITKNFLAITTMVLAFSSTTFAQVSAVATTTAVFVSPLTITKTVDMHFGTLASSTLGTATMTTAGVVTGAGGVTRPAGGITPTAAAFNVTGQGTSTYSILVPAADITLTGSVTGTVTVGSFVSAPSLIGTLTAGAQTITVGATLAAPAATAAGTYTNLTGLIVTVAYN